MTKRVESVSRVSLYVDKTHILVRWFDSIRRLHNLAFSARAGMYEETNLILTCETLLRFIFYFLIWFDSRQRTTF